MSHNSFGKLFRVTTFGESHGPAIGCVIDGCPPGLEITAEEIRAELVRRATGRSRHTSQRREKDEVQILSGMFEGRTTGTPIALLIENTDARPKDYTNIANRFRPGHADYTYWKKYGFRDYRGGGRSSARETTMRVAAGALARKYLRESFGIDIYGWLAQLGPIRTDEQFDRAEIEQNPFFCPDAGRVSDLETYMDELRKSGDSVGARISAVAMNVPAGLGEPVYGKLDADLAHAMMGINAAKGVEIGAGFDCVAQMGTEHRDEITRDGFLS
ncbi:MAG: chorismate synthase, partial [Xanthomonadales bacterium]|nr:chorismate synthase [Xanthomonadales bacterium]NIX11859.1 chorismate synthase [Xanthomonadales bacterium]